MPNIQWIRSRPFLAFCHGGILTLAEDGQQKPSNMLFQEGGDVLVMLGGIPTRIQMSVVKQPTSTFLVNEFQLLILSVLPLQSRKVHEGPAKGLRKPSW